MRARGYPLVAIHGSVRAPALLRSSQVRLPRRSGRARLPTRGGRTTAVHARWLDSAAPRLLLLPFLLVCAGAWPRPPALSAQGAEAVRAAPAPAALQPPQRYDTLLDLAEKATRMLTCGGFANVAAVVEDRRFVVTVENARYRDERRALRVAAALLLPVVSPGRELVLINSDRGIPLLIIRYPAPAGTAPHQPPPVPAVALDVSGLPPALRSAPRANSSFGRVDVILHPWFEARYGDYDEPVRSRTGVAPELRVALRPGLVAAAQVLVAVQDELHPEQRRIRPVLATVSQTVRLPQNVFVSAAAGAFRRDRYGADVEVRAYLGDGRWVAGGEAGLTGAVSYGRDRWRFSAMEEPTALVELAHRNVRYGLTLRATAGAFLADYRGVRLEAVRQFGELEVGWFALRSSLGSNAGVTLRIPLPPATRSHTGPVRIRMADAFVWEYRYQELEPGGRRYDAGGALEALNGRLDPDRLMGKPGFVGRGTTEPCALERSGPRARNRGETDHV